MASNDPLEDKRVEDLAAHLAETTDKNVPNLLLALQGMWDEY